MASHPSPLAYFVFAIAITLSCSSDIWAYKRESRVPLAGYHGYFAAQGSARYQSLRNIPRTKDHDELIVEIKNVPLPPGTTLVVYFGDEVIGDFKLDSRQSGSIKLVSEKGFVPPIEPGSIIALKTVEGKLICR